MALKRISVVIPTVGRAEDLRACLVSIREADAPQLAEIVIVDDCAAAPFVTAVTFPPNVVVRVIRNPTRLGAGQSRNIGAAAAEGEILAFLDDDARVTMDWFAVVERELTTDRTAITGPVIGFDSSLVARARQRRYENRYRRLSDGERVDFMAGGNCAIWRSTFVTLGGFPSLPTMSDSVFGKTLDTQTRGCYFIRALKVRHRNSKGLAIAIGQAFGAGLVRGRLPVEHRPTLRDADAFVASMDGAALLNACLQVIWNVGRYCGWALSTVMAFVNGRLPKEEHRGHV